MLDKLSPRADETARETAEAWVNAFGLALARSEELDAGGADVTTAYEGLDHLLSELFGEDVASRVGRVWGFGERTLEMRNMWTRTARPGLWFTAGSFSQARVFSRYIALQIDAIEAQPLGKSGESR